MLLNQSLISLTGRAERGSNLNIISEDIDADGVYEDVGFNIEPQNNNRIRVFDCIPTDNNTTNGIEEICTWEVSNFQLDRDSENNIDVITNLSFNLSDSAGNTIEKNLSLNVNLFRVSLHSKTNSIYFSPNGDGKADGIEFYDIDTDGQILMYKLSILDIHLNEVRSFEGYGTPPTNILWDGKDYNNNFVEDGQYTYSLSIQTLDGVEIITDPVSLFAVTELSDSVVIINPGDDSYTTRGVTTVIGQAPANTLVTVCSNVIGLSGECNIEETVYSNNHGVFSLIFPLLRLPDQNITEHYISAYATDEFSNNTNVSNIVKISVTNQNPFNEISITPVFTGVNSPDDYQIIIDKINRNEEITLDDINSLRTVRFRSNVAQGTERVKFFYSNLTNLELLPDEVSSEYIGFIDGQNITRLYQEFTDGVTNYQNCNSSSCTWDMYYPVPYGLGGLIEISFEGKLGTTIQTLSSPLIIDSNIPTAPMILDIKKLESNQWVNTNKSNNTYFSNSNNVIVYGISDPSAIIEIVDQNNNLLCSTTSSSVGLFTCEIEYTEETTSHLNVIATLDQNSQSSLNSETLIIDTTAPEVVQVNTSTFWRNSGDIVDIEVIASEELRNTLHADYSNLICANNDIQNGAVRFLPIQDSKEKAIGSFTVSGNAVNGRYCSTLLITDLAGNQTLENYVLFIDNEKPDKPIIDSEDWGIFNGMNAKKDFISKGRLNPEFVTNDRIITLRAFGEQNQTAELFVNGKLHSQKSIEGGICYASKDQNYQDLLTDLEFDSVVVENQYQCNVDFKFTFPSETGFEFQIKVKDIAGNYSGISDNKVIYFDKTKPETPSTFSVSSQGNIINDWNAALNQDIIASTLGTGNYGKLPITNRRNIEIKDLAEALSDIEYIRESPSGRKSTTIQQKSGSGFDDRVETLSEDGIYTFTSTSWDAAGNKSNVHKFQIELDTIKPNKPELGNVYICGSNLCIDAKGEDGAFINVNGVDFDRVSITQSKSLVILSNWKYNTKYEFNVGIADRAGNISDTEFKTFYIPAGIGGGGSSNNPSAAYKNAKAWVTIGRDGNASLDWFEHVPAPVLTTPIVDFGTKDVTINGSSIPSGYVYDVDVTIKKEFNFVEENTVFSKCGYPSIFFSPDPECVKDLIGEAEYNRRESVYNSCKIYTVLNPILYTFCKMNGIYNEEMVLSETFNETTTLGISKSLVNLYKNNAQLSVIDGKDKDGHFSQVFNSGGGNNNLTEGDKVKAKLFLNGSMEIDFDNNKYTLQLGSDSKGWESGFSNEVVVGKEPEFRDLSVDPLNNCGCNVKISNRFIAITNENSTIISHNGVDFAVPEGSRIDSAGPGVVEYVGWGNGGQGYYITIRHINGTWANYLHGNGDFFVKAGDNVSAGQHIMNSGNSGNSSGPHLHFEYWLSKPWSYIYPNATGSVNPYLYLNLNNYEKLYE
jgi:murein DD-endopeptidase MepM/ murein hydrolase activator NlpD